jgi:hypothetical protein
METNFFQQVSALSIAGNLILNIQPVSETQMIVSVMITNDAIRDKAVRNIPPMVLDGSIAELNEKFFTAIIEPVKKTTQLFRNMLEHEKGLNTAQGNSNMQKGITAAGKSNRKQYDEKMKKVTELEKEKKYGQAIAQMPDAKQFPEFANEINKKMAQLRGNHGTLDLFASPEAGSTENTKNNSTGDPNEDESHRDDEDEDNPSLEDDDPEAGLEEDDELPEDEQ